MSLFFSFTDLIPQCSSIVTIAIGREERLFAAHEDVLCHSPFFLSACRDTFFNKRIDLPDEEPEIFSCILEYLYKGDYHPKLGYDKKRNTWHLEDDHQGGNGTAEATIYTHSGPVLKDTVIYVRFIIPHPILSYPSPS